MSVLSSATSLTDPLAAKAATTIAYTDGACKGNPGAGGWGAHLIFSDGSTQDVYGGEAKTTNNRMELMGAIQAIEHSPAAHTLEIWTDSSYVQKGITEWVAGWKARGWKTASKKPVANQDLWQQLDNLCSKRDVSWHWVKGHAGHAGNEKADALANLGVHGSSADATDAKKKPHTDAVDAPAADDWLTNDPLGFNMMSDSFIDDMPMDDAKSSAAMHTSQPASTEVSMMDTPVTAKTVTADMDNETDSVPFDGDTSRANPHFKPLLPHPKHRHESNRQLIMDTETTGLDAQKGDRVIEVGIVELVGRRFTGEKLHVYINPERGMDEEVIRIHGISEAFLADKPVFADVAQSLYDFMYGAEVIAHNAPFDMSFLLMEFDRVGLHDFAASVQVTDSLWLAKQQYPGQKNTLDALVRRLNVGKQDRTFHGALLDSEILAEVYLAMTGGQVALAIEEDTQSEQGQSSHHHFAALADKLVRSSRDTHAHQDWFAKLSDDYPEIKAAMSQWSVAFE
ncbi:DNA polymerase III subunit epsilon [Psychrobacter aestuarii]|uniref:Ribonuclease H n=1 Tax=Psychrobacter aestuarii TaxID=556327 RepID=A0ABP3FAC9_9GAMM|nr:DNA polymerase III subunit epsilon [Psychrobacter aestuarii]